MRLLLEDLGPTYVKLGQIVSSQGRALPSAWEAELEKLQSGVHPFSYDDVRTIVMDSLGGLPETLYASFDPTPLAAVVALGDADNRPTWFFGAKAVSLSRWTPSLGSDDQVMTERVCAVKQNPDAAKTCVWICV